ncbi:MAG: nitroreductase family deazaflavin-dependent oxidoreductase [Rhodoglobus sp.]|nr:nitroreductase family deazaflavin-dependent oxidoreductase [Rhodoglobus sp.]
MYRAVRAATASFLRGPARHALGPLITSLDRALFRVSDGRLKLSAPIIPSLMLFTTGAKTGLRRESPLMCFPRPDGSWLIAGSNWGLEKHPAWSGNLLANPDVEIHYRRSLIPVRASMLSAADAEAAWPILEEQWPHYRDYEKTALRDIRVFRLERR